jgi:hypothetical protein
MITAAYLKWRIRANFINGSGAVPPIVADVGWVRV